MKVDTPLVTEVALVGKAQRALLDHGDLRDALKAKEVAGVFKFQLDTSDRGGVVKQVHTLEGAFATGNRPIGKATITTADEDRDRDIVHTGGMVLTEGYKKNPVVLPMHQYREFPIGMTVKLAQYERHTVASWEFLTDQPATRAADYYQLWSAHVLNATSIGFVPIDFQWVEARMGLDWLSWELLEHSVVTIPANGNALRTNDAQKHMKLLEEAAMSGPSVIVRRSLESALSEASSAVAVGLPDGMKKDPVTESGEEKPDPDERAHWEESDEGKRVDVVRGTEGGESASGAADFDPTGLPISRVLSALSAGVISKAATVAEIEKRIAAIAAERDEYRQRLANLGLSVLANKIATEV